MAQADLKYFELLKKDISERLRSTCPGIGPDMTEWKGDEIARFQEDLIKRANGRISEKWFYTHIKNPDGRLPRVDILNLLSRYVGFGDWNEFKNSKPPQFESRKSNFRSYILLTLLVLISGGAFTFWAIQPMEPLPYTFCFINAMSKETLTEKDIELIILKKSESPYLAAPDSNGCFTIASTANSVQFVVKGPYFKTDTITRIMDKKQTREIIPVPVNDYAMMIHIFSTGNVQDWERRRQQLERMFSDEAQIYQVVEGAMIGVEMYNKKEFIDKLTMPVSSLKNIHIIETIYEGKKIKELRFRQSGGHYE